MIPVVPWDAPALAALRALLFYLSVGAASFSVVANRTSHSVSSHQATNIVPAESSSGNLISKGIPTNCAHPVKQKSVKSILKSRRPINHILNSQTFPRNANSFSLYFR